MGEPKGAAAPFAMVARFDGPAALTRACRALRDAGYRRFDAHTPFPVHGLEDAMGLQPSRLPYVALVGGIVGGLAGFGLQYWVHSIAYPLNYSGKPYFAFQAYIPITFELSILFAAFGTFFGLWRLIGLPQLFHPVMQHGSFERASDDGFFVSVEAADARYDAQATRALLVKLGAHDLEEVQP